MLLPVLLVHGLGRTPLSLVRLGRRLSAAGAQPHYFGYFAWAEPWDRILDRLASRLRQFARQGPVGLVGHSLGGLLLRHACLRVAELEIHHLVMLGTPNRGTRLAVQARRWMAFRLFTRSCGAMLADPATFELPPPGHPWTVIAGTRGLSGRWSPFGPEPNDGFVAVEETRVGDTMPLVLPVHHTFMMNHPGVQAAVLAALGLPDPAAR